MAKATDSPKTIYSAQALLCAFAIGTGCRKKKKKGEKASASDGPGFWLSVCSSQAEITIEHSGEEQSASSQAVREEKNNQNT